MIESAATPRDGRLRVLFVTTAIDRSGAGLFEAVNGLATRLISPNPGAALTVVSVSSTELTQEQRAAWNGVEIVAERASSRIGGIRAIYRSLARLSSNNYDLIHAHGLWDGAAVASAAWAKRNKKPFVLSPHGMLEPWAFEHKMYKKAVPWLLWEKRAITAATVIEVKSRKEARGVASRGFCNPLAVIPIGVDSPPLPRARGEAGPVRTCVYVSRIHPVKGLENLIRAWAAVRPRGWSLAIAGPDGGAYQRTLEQQVVASNLTEQVRFVGPVFGDSKWSLLQSAELFVLPSFSENFGVAVVEALSQEVPVITTTATPWDELVSRKCGWQVEPNSAGIQRALSQAVSLPPDQLRQMGKAGRRYVDDCFRWEFIAAETLSLYAWACCGGAAPRSLHGGFSHWAAVR
jgi:glycosyltransferase involved in cell wall biosynthesis